MPTIHSHPHTPQRSPLALHLLITLIASAALCACGADGGGGNGDALSADGNTSGTSGGGTLDRDISQNTLDGASSGGNAGGSACAGVNSEGSKDMTLPGTGVEYCVKAHPDCAQAGADCPLYVMSNSEGTFFNRVDDPDQYGRFIIALSSGTRDGQTVKDWVAELPRVIAADYPGLDPQRIYMVGWSAGAGAVFRGQCSSSKGFDASTYGTTSDLYAAIVTLGGCPACSDNFKPISGNFHVFATNGRLDQFGGDGCEDNLRALAQTNGCSDLNGTWRNVTPSDPYTSSGDSSDNAQKITFGDCPGGDVVGYRFADEAHVVSYKKHYDPKISAYDLVWTFLQGRTKGPDSLRGFGE
jgi:dienelactone hydrolase